MQMTGTGYNVFVLGHPGTGKLTATRQELAKQAAERPVPADWCYVNNFVERTKPKALELPAGQGRRFKSDMEQLVDDLRSAIPAAFESDEYRLRAEQLEEESKERGASAIETLRGEAANLGIALIETPTGFAFAPVDKKQRVLNPERFKKLADAERAQIEKNVGELQQRLQKVMRQFPGWHKETKQKIKTLNREAVRYAVSHLIDALKLEYSGIDGVPGYLDDVQQHIIDHVEDFRSPPEAQMFFPGAGVHEDPFARCRVNLLIDHSEDTSAPIIYENLPNHANLIGCVEYQAHMGALVTDFALIKQGALHKANGGYLVLNARKLLTQPYAWESLKRTLKYGEIRIESLEQTLSLIHTTSLEPEPIPLDVKIILIGERYFYYLLCSYDPEFRELFKVAADFEDSMNFNAEDVVSYSRMLGSIARRQQLRPLDKSAVARTIEHSARLAGDAEKLSTHMRSITDLLRESDHWAGQANRGEISNEDVQQAIDHQIHRGDRLRSRIYEAIQRGTLLIETQDQVIGQINGLSVIELGDFAFGQPSRITATTRLGDGKVIDIERETKLGGAIHSKGVLILSGFVSSRYARKEPFSLSASLVFEQSYGTVEGDSASLAELCAMLSSLAGLAIRQSLAVTGSVNQHGQVQPIGGVNEKIEGFFDVCKNRGLTGEQGVLIPAANVKHLMLREDVVEAVKQQQFSVYALASVDQALELLTGTVSGERDENGEFPEDSVNGKVERQLCEFAKIQQESKGQEKTNDD